MIIDNLGPAPNVVWVTRSFLDYRIPVFSALSRLLKGRLSVVYSGDYVPSRIIGKIREALKEHAVDMRGEWRLGREDRFAMANRNLSLRFQPGLIKQVHNLRPDIVICDGFFKWAFQMLPYVVWRKLPLLVTYERTTHTERRVQWFRSWYRKAVVRRVDAMACSGSECRTYVRTLGMPEERTTTGHMVADVPFFSEESDSVSIDDVTCLRHKHNVRGVLFCFVGRVIPNKGCQELIAAWEAFEKGRDIATLLVVGSGDLMRPLQEVVLRRSISSVRFVGDVPYDELPLYYRASDVLVMPTLEDNWSLVVPEAMACGLPILCSCYNGCWPELVKPENGWVFDPLDGGEFVDVLRKTISRPKRLREMGQASRQIVGRYTPESAAASVLRACRIAIRRRTGVS